MSSYQQKKSFRILGFFCVIFWPELAKMSILFEILNSDDMHNYALDMLCFLLKY